MSEIGLTLAVRGVMVSNENPTPGWIPVKGQKKFNERYSSLSQIASCWCAIQKLFLN